MYHIPVRFNSHNDSWSVHLSYNTKLIFDSETLPDCLRSKLVMIRLHHEAGADDAHNTMWLCRWHKEYHDVGWALGSSYWRLYKIEYQIGGALDEGNWYSVVITEGDYHGLQGHYNKKGDGVDT